MEKNSAGMRMQKMDLAVRMVKTSPRGRNLKAAILGMKRNPVKKPRATTRSFSLKNSVYSLLKLHYLTHLLVAGRINWSPCATATAKRMT